MEELTRTANAQLATFVLSLVVLDAVERLGLTPAACAGHSLGEYTALVASGALVLRPTASNWSWPAARPWPGRRRSARDHGRPPRYRRRRRRGGLQRAEGDVWVANYNAPGQVVIAGTAQRRRRARANGPRSSERERSCPSRFRAPSTPPSCMPARAPLRKALADVTFLTPEVRVVANVDARRPRRPRRVARPSLCPAVQPRALAPDPRDLRRPRR